MLKKTMQNRSEAEKEIEMYTADSGWLRIIALSAVLNTDIEMYGCAILEHDHCLM